MDKFKQKMSQKNYFDKKLLQFISFLTRNQKIMDSKEISRCFELNGEKICERTTRRWFQDLQTDLDYYAVPRYEKLGLAYCHIFISGLKNIDMVKIIPYNSFFLCGTRLETSESNTLLAYLIPREHLKDFENFWAAAKKSNLLDNYEIFTARDTVYFYSKFHETFHQGVSNFATDDENYFFDILQNALRKNHAIEIDKNIRENPLIIPIILERFRETWSSPKIWKSAREKLNENIWDYIKDLRTRLNRSDNAGIKLVQRTLKYVNADFDSFFRQVKVDYAPLFSHKNNLFAYLMLDIGQEKLLDFMKVLHKNSLQCAVFLPHDKKNRYMFFTLTDFSGYNRIVQTLGTYKNTKKTIMWADHEATKKYWTRDFMKFDYSKAFDPKNCEWVYEHDKYMDKLDNLAGN